MSALGAAATGSADAVKKNKEEVAAAAGAPWVDGGTAGVEESATGEGKLSGHV